MSLKNFVSWVEGEREAFDFDLSSPKKQSDGKFDLRKFLSLGISSGETDFAIRFVSVIAAVVLLGVLLSVVYTLPMYGTGVTTDNELSQRYIEQGMSEVGAQNLVANIILVYRGFDTLGESTVLFTAATCVIMLLMLGGHGAHSETVVIPAAPEKNTEILRTVVRGMFPFVLVFGVYILLNGHLSPGGGFSGGSVLGAGLILLDISLGSETLGKFFNHTVYLIIKVGALVIYGFIILYLVLCGANGIDNGISLGIAGNILSAGVILPINLMVGFEVACTMYAFFTYFYRGELK